MQTARIGNLIRKVHKTISFSINPSKQSIPVFILGKHRSGTSLLFRVLSRNLKVCPFNEKQSSAIFDNYKVRSFDNIKKTVQRCGAPVALVKPISDSDAVLDFIKIFPDCKILWIYRNFRDVTNSTFRKWPEVHQFIRNQIQESNPGPFFSKNTYNKVKTIYHSGLSDYECVCLIWWVKNMIVVENNLDQLLNVMLIDYDKLIKNVVPQFDEICRFIGVKFNQNHAREVNQESFKKAPFGDVDLQIKTMCEDLESELEQRYLSNRRLHSCSDAI